MNKKFFSGDERVTNIFAKVCTVRYIVTIFALIGIVLYRQFVLNQPSQQWIDIAMLMTLNVIVMLGAGLFLTGSINPTKIKFRYIFSGYVIFMLLGFDFTLFKNSVFEGMDVDLAFAFDKLKIIISISGLFVLGWGLLAYLGSRKLEKQIT